MPEKSHFLGLKCQKAAEGWGETFLWLIQRDLLQPRETHLGHNKPQWFIPEPQRRLSLPERYTPSKVGNCSWSLLRRITTNEAENKSVSKEAYFENPCCVYICLPMSNTVILELSHSGVCILHHFRSIVWRIVHHVVFYRANIRMNEVMLYRSSIFAAMEAKWCSLLGSKQQREIVTC